MKNSRNITDFQSYKNFTRDIEVPSKILSDDLLLPFGIPLFVENLVTILILLRSRRLIYQVRILSINLAISDCLTGLSLSLPDSVYTFGNCILQKYITTIFIIVSLFTVTMINFDRYCAMKYALKYYRIMTKRVLIISCVTFWVVGTLLAYMLSYDPAHPFGIFCGVMYQAPVTVVSESAIYLILSTIISNAFIYVCMINVLSKRLLVAGTTSNAVEKCNIDGATEEQINVIKKVSVINGCFLLCCTPYFVFRALRPIPNLDFENSSVRLVNQITAGMCMINSAINPVLYVWRFTEARYQFKRLLFFWSPNQLRALKVKRDIYFSTYDIATISRSKI